MKFLSRSTYIADWDIRSEESEEGLEGLNQSIGKDGLLSPIECTGNINNGETKECTVQDYVIAVNEISNDEIDILTNSNESQQILKTNDVKQTSNTTSIIPSIPFSFDIPIT